jgi:hypothetical protein
MRAAVLCAGLVGAVGLTGACRTESPAHPTWVPLQVIRGTNTDTVRLEAAPGEWRVLQLLPHAITPDLEVRSVDLGDIAAVTETRDGMLLVLNRRDGFVLVLDSTGRAAAKLGRRGDGPGELRMPYAITVLGQQVVVLQEAARGNTLTIFNVDGTSPRGRAPPVDGDWGLFTQRGPNVLLDYPTQSGVEDWTRRLLRESDSTFLVGLRSALEIFDPEPASTGREESFVLLRFSPALELLDTVWSAPAAASYFTTQGSEQAPPRLADRLFAGRPVWATGDGWLAVSHGDSGAISIMRRRQESDLRITWAPRRTTITEPDRVAAARWAAEYTARAFPEAAERFARMSSAQREEANRLYLGYLLFADSVPQVTALYGYESCLWAANFDPSHFVDGTGPILLGLNVERPAELAVVAVPMRDARIRHVSARGIYVKVHDPDGEPYLIRLRLPSSGCVAAG